MYVSLEFADFTLRTSESMSRIFISSIELFYDYCKVDQLARTGTSVSITAEWE